MALSQYSHAMVVRGSGGFRDRRTPCQNMGFISQRKRVLVHCCSSPPTDQKLSFLDVKLKPGLQFGYLVSDGNWQVRRMVETLDEMKKIAGVQAEAFHEPAAMFDEFFFELFKAEVHSGLLYRLRNSPPDRYACLVAEPRDDCQLSRKEPVGVVDVTVQREDSVLEHLPGADEYLYVSGIAVLNKFRRQKVASTLLKACDVLAAIWGHEHLVLRAYEDDYGAQKLYTNAGYRIISGDPPWMSTWLGKRRRVVMFK